MKILDDQEIGRFRAQLLAVCEELRAAGIVNSLNDWAVKAKVPPSTLTQFLSGRSHSLSIKTYIALADVANRPFTALLSSHVARSDQERLILDAFRGAEDDGKEVMIALARREMRERSPS